MKGLDLRKHANLFRGQEAYNEFLELLRRSVDEDELSVVFDDSSEFIGTFMSPQAVRELMQHRILKRFYEQPDLLDELQERLTDNEQLVELVD